MSTAIANDLDQDKVNAFTERLVGILTGGAEPDDRHRPSHGVVRRDGRAAAVDIATRLPSQAGLE